MSDLQTMVKQLLREVRIDTAGTQSTVDAKIAIIDAIDSQKQESLWFNKNWTKITLSTGQFRYSLPSDFLSLSGDVTFIGTSNEPAARRRLEPSTLNELIESSFVGADPSESILTGAPSKYGIDGSSNEILLIPVPAIEGDQIEFQYMVNHGVPTYSYNGSAWVFYEPNSTTTLADTFTNAWLATDKGYKLVFYRAAYNLLTGPYGGTEPMLVKATEYIKRWAEELGRLKGENAKRSATYTIRRHI